MEIKWAQSREDEGVVGYGGGCMNLHSSTSGAAYRMHQAVMKTLHADGASKGLYNILGMGL